MHRIHCGLVWSLRAGLLALFGASLDCATLEKIDTNTCGNGVIDYDKGEDCDGFAVSGAPCRAKGQESACHLDCSPGEAGTVGKCPTGWGCGVTDKVCHAPGEGYVVKNGFASAESAFKLMVGDYDGDGRKDILAFGRRGPTGTARARVHFTGAAGLSSLAIPSSIGPGTFSDLDGDGKDDIVFANIGYGVLRGNAERVLSPLALPISKSSQAVRLAPLHMRPEVDPNRSTRTVTGLIAFVDGAATVFVPSGPAAGDVTLTALEPIAMAPGAPPSAFHFLTGRIDEPLRFFTTQTSVCGDAVAWVEGTTQVRIYRTCNDNPEKASIGSPSPARVVDVPGIVALAVGDVDGDGLDDVVAQVDRVEKPKPAQPDEIVRRLIKLSAPDFQPTALPFLGQTVSTSGVLDPELDLPSRLLGVRDLNGDRRGDVIFGSVVALSTVGASDAGGGDAGGGGVVSYRTGYQRLTAPWREVVTGDFDGDGRVDLIGSNAAAESDAGNSGNSDLDVLLAPGYQYVPQVLSTGAPASRLSVGDFDGDGTDDVAFGVQNIDGTADLRVAFGKRNASPYDVVTVASSVVGLSQIVNQTTGRAGGVTDDIHDIGFVAQTTENSKTISRLYVALGGADRQPTTRILLDHISNGAVGARLRNASPEILSLGVKDPPAGVALRRKVLAGGSSLLDSAGSYERCGLGVDQVEVEDGATFVFGVVPLSADRDQLLLGVGRSASDRRPARLLLSGLRLGDPPLRSAEGFCTSVPWVRTMLPEIAANIDDFSEVRGGDLDGDGLPDILVLAGALSARAPGPIDPRDAGAPQVIEGTKIYVLYGQKSGGFKNASELPVGDAPGGMALLRSDDGKTILGTLTSKGVSLFRMEVDNKLVAIKVNIEGDTKGISPAPQPSAIAGGDFDGDGLDDIAIVADGVLRVLFRKQCAEASCRKVAP